MTPIIHHDAMNDMLQVMIPAALTILVAYQSTPVQHRPPAP